MADANVASFKVFNALAASGTNTYYGGKGGGTTSATGDGGTAIPRGHDASIVVDLAGTGNATLTVEVSNSSEAEVEKGTDKWVPYAPIGSIPIASGVFADGTAVCAIELKTLPFGRFRPKLVMSSGTLTVNGTVTVKSRG